MKVRNLIAKAKFLAFGAAIAAGSSVAQAQATSTASLTAVTDGLDDLASSVAGQAPAVIGSALVLTAITIGVVWLIATFRRAKK